MNRRREQEPSRETTQGQLLHYVAHLIERKGLTVDEVAEAAGVHRTTMFRWLRGDGTSPTIDHMEAIAEALGFQDLWAMKPPKSFIDKL